MLLRKLSHTKDFCTNNLAVMAAFSELAYLEPEQAIQTLNNYNIELIDQDIYISNEQTKTQLYIIADTENIIISFRGSSDAQDVKTSFKFKKIHWHEDQEIGQIHQGFYQAVQSVWLEIEEKINAIYNGKQKLWLTGHSMGGALAQICACKLLLKQQPLPVEFHQLYNFASPRVFSHKLTKQLDNIQQNQFFRILNQSDIISVSPPRFINYRHLGQLKVFNRSKTLLNEEQLNFWQKSWATYSDLYWALALPLCITPLLNLITIPFFKKAHDIINYRKNSFNCAQLPDSLWRD